MGSTRREFVKLMTGAAVAPSLSRVTAETGQTSSDAPDSRMDLEFLSAWLRVQMAADQPGFIALAVDSLGKNKLDENVMLPLAQSTTRYRVTRENRTIRYSLAEAEDSPVWTFEFDDRGFTIRSNYSAKLQFQPLVLGLTVESHATLLGLLTDYGTMDLPALLHLPHQGTLRITTTMKRVSLGYDASRAGEKFIRVSFPPANGGQKQIEYRFEVADIYPGSGRASIENDPRYDGYRRDFLTILQINPRRRVLANNSASDACAFTLFEYSMMAVHLPPLAEGLSANDILRQSLDRYVGQMKGYGIIEYDDQPYLKYAFLDTYPSLVMATSDYVKASGDSAWLKRNYSVIKNWAGKMIEFDGDHDGLMEYPASGNSGSWGEGLTLRPANWWDTIGFGHKDAYSNALAYKAFRDMEALAREAGMPADAAIYKRRAEMLRTVYYPTFYNPATGVLAGWKSSDGKLHDYYFLFVNGVAETFGLLTDPQGNEIWDKLMAKMKEVGYNRFDLGLPGNLIPVRREDCVDLHPADAFQIYENGGATACFAYFTIQALRKLGREREADAILFPMLKSFEAGGFQGRGPNGKTYDWTAWDGTPHGYEGLLVDGYLTLLAALPASDGAA
jgi:Bacterial alpha-L-rhamnosidase 6 hairpin glycosidase domain